MLTTIISAFEETLSMVLISGFFTILFGLPLGFLLYGLVNKQLFANKFIYYFLQLAISFLNNTPYLLITVFSIPLIKFLSDNNSSSTAAIIPLTIAAIPLYSTLVFEAIKQLPPELSNTIKILGATPWQAIVKIYLPEILPVLITALSKTLTQLLSYSTIAGLFGAGGIGALVMQKGYYSFELNYIIACALMLIASMQIIQFSSNLVVKKISKI